MLGEIAELDAIAQSRRPAHGRPALENGVDERRLATSVRPDEPDVLPALEREGDVREQEAVTSRHRELLHLDDRAAAARRLQELEAQPPGPAAEQRSLSRGGLLLLLEPCDLGELRLRLASLALLVAEALDEALQADDVVGHAIDGLLRVQRPLGLLPPPDVPRAGKERGAPRLELQHCRGHRLEEPPVVGHQDHGCVERLELALEPFQAGDVQVVRRLVEEQEVRVARERACQRRPRELAARERVQRPVELVVGEAETAHEAGGPLAPAPATRVLEPRLRPRVALHRRRGVIAARHRLLEAT